MDDFERLTSMQSWFASNIDHNPIFVLLNLGELEHSTHPDKEIVRFLNCFPFAPTYDLSFV